MSFFEELRKTVLEVGSPLCVGIDPHWSELKDFLKKEVVVLGDKAFLRRFCEAHLAAAAGKVAAVKFQSSFFETFGPNGLEILQQSIASAHQKNLHVILDAKRGDIASTMAAYGKAAFDFFNADCLTVNAYMGSDVLAALSPWLTKDCGVYIVWLTSNKSAGELQNLKLEDGKLLYEHMFTQLKKEATKLKFEKSLGWVIGANQISDVKKSVKTKIQKENLLLPGVGAQGATIDKKLQEFLAKNDGRSLIPISRGLSFGDGNEALKNWDEYEELIGKRLQNFQSLINN